MKIVTTPLKTGSAVALGLFDGVHVGHQSVLTAAAGCAEKGLVPCAFTFSSATLPHKHGQTFSYLYPEAQKMRLMEKCGIQAVYHPAFETLQHIDGASFCREVLQEMLCAHEVYCGRDFRFGAGASWNFGDLCRYGVRLGFRVHAVEAVEVDGEKVSSTLIRRYLVEGRPQRAAELLGAPYTIESEVRHGRELGRTMSFPTINQEFEIGQLVPRYGVYLSRVRTPEGCFWGVTNVGIKPTVGRVELPMAETHLLGYEGNLYGTCCRTALLHFIRAERKFPDMNALQNAIAQDCMRARQLAENISEH